MPTFEFEAMDERGQEIRDVIDAPSEEEAQSTIRGMGYFITRIAPQQAAVDPKGGKAGRQRAGFTIGGVSSAQLTEFTRRLAVLQDAGLPILKSLQILERQEQPGRLKNCLMDVCDEIEAGATLSEAMAKSPAAFDRLYVNMIRAGEAGGALETILKRLAEFMERAEELKRKVIGALIYPAVVIFVAIGILAGIMYFIVPIFEKIFVDFELDLPTPTLILIQLSGLVVNYWYLIPLFPLAVWLGLYILQQFPAGRMGWDQFLLKVPILGWLMEKNALARATRTLGTLITSGVPILEALNITRDTSGNGMFEQMFSRVGESIREGEPIYRPLRAYSVPGFHPVTLFIWAMAFAIPFMPLLVMSTIIGWYYAVGGVVAPALIGIALYVTRMNQPIVDEMVVSMVEVGEETGELDTMLYKVADNYDDEVKTYTESLTKLIEPLLIVFLGGAVGFIVISLFLPLVSLISNLSG